MCDFTVTRYCASPRNVNTAHSCGRGLSNDNCYHLRVLIRDVDPPAVRSRPEQFRARFDFTDRPRREHSRDVCTYAHTSMTIRSGETTRRGDRSFPTTDCVFVEESFSAGWSAPIDLKGLLHSLRSPAHQIEFFFIRDYGSKDLVKCPKPI